MSTNVINETLKANEGKLNMEQKLEQCRRFFDELAELLGHTYTVLGSCNKDVSAYLIPAGTEEQLSYYGKPKLSFRISDHWNWYASLYKCSDPRFIQCNSLDMPWARRRPRPGAASKPIRGVQVAFFGEDGVYHHVYGERFDRETRTWIWDVETTAEEFLVSVGVTPSTVDPEETLASSRPAYIYDHKGRGFGSFADMCFAYGFAPNTVRERESRGWTREQALMTPVDHTTDPRECVDHKGVHYLSETAMCAAHHIHPRTYRFRRDIGMSVEDALTTPLMKDSVGSPIMCQDHFGNTYGSYKEMCRKYGIPHSTYCSRLKRGWSQERALTEPSSNKPKEEWPKTDHLKIEYASFGAMSRAYGLVRSTVKDRLLRGWSLEDALTKPVNVRNRRKKPYDCKARRKIA